MQDAWRRSHEWADFLLDFYKSEPGFVWDNYGIRADVVVRVPAVTNLHSQNIVSDVTDDSGSPLHMTFHEQIFISSSHPIFSIN